eukprot:3536934-Amphidinium_carterae.1
MECIGEEGIDETMSNKVTEFSLPNYNCKGSSNIVRPNIEWAKIPLCLHRIAGCGSSKLHQKTAILTPVPVTMLMCARMLPGQGLLVQGTSSFAGAMSHAQLPCNAEALPATLNRNQKQHPEASNTKDFSLQLLNLVLHT